MSTPEQQPVTDRWPAQLADDAMRVVLCFDRPDSPDPAEPAACVAALEEVGVAMDDALHAQLIAALKAKAGDRITLHATPPRDGADGWILWADGMAPRDTASPPPPPPSPAAATSATTDDATVDFYSHSRYISVEAGQELARVVPPTPGTPGRNLRGETLPANDGEPAALETDGNTVSRDSEDRCVARIGGVLRYDGQTLSVDETLVIDEDVDFETGNIKVGCDVLVNGAVRDRFRITTGSNLRVEGLIESATIHTRGNCEAAGGMVGKYRGRLLVEGDLQARYLNQVHAEVRGSAIVEREIIQSTLDVGGSLHLEQGALISGRLSLMGDAIIGRVGSESDEPTLIELGIDRRFEACIAEADAALRAIDRQNQQAEQRRQEIAAMPGSQQQRLAAEQDALAERTRLLEQRRDHIARKRNRLAAHYAERPRGELYVGRLINRRTRLVTPKCRAEMRHPIKGPLRIITDEAGALHLRDERSRRSVPLEDYATVTYPGPRAAAQSSATD